jgi:hypothetical protein
MRQELLEFQLGREMKLFHTIDLDLELSFNMSYRDQYLQYPVPFAWTSLKIVRMSNNGFSHAKCLEPQSCAIARDYN